MASKDPSMRAAIWRNAHAAERERLRNLARQRWPEAAGDELEQRVDQLEREKLQAAGRRGATTVRSRLALARRVEAAHPQMVEIAECLLDLLREVAPSDPDTCEHDWPDELEADDRCSLCHLPYGDWTEQVVA